MKTADLKAGETYAVRRQIRPCLLLSTDVYREQQHSWSSKPDEYQLARPGTKPRRDSSYASATNYGFITLTAEADVLAALDVAETLAAILADSRTGRPEDTSIEFVTSAAAFLGRHEEHQAAEQLRRNADAARRDEAKQRRLAAATRHNAVARRLNAAVGGDGIALARLDGHSEPDCVKLTLAQAEALADLLDTVTPNLEA